MGIASVVNAGKQHNFSYYILIIYSAIDFFGEMQLYFPWTWTKFPSYFYPLTLPGIFIYNIYKPSSWNERKLKRTWNQTKLKQTFRYCDEKLQKWGFYFWGSEGFIFPIKRGWVQCMSLRIYELFAKPRLNFVCFQPMLIKWELPYLEMRSKGIKRWGFVKCGCSLLCETILYSGMKNIPAWRIMPLYRNYAVI